MKSGKLFVSPIDLSEYRPTDGSGGKMFDLEGRARAALAEYEAELAAAAEEPSE
jgi:hypothetical protein